MSRLTRRGWLLLGAAPLAAKRRASVPADIPRWLELASVPGLSLGLIEDGKVGEVRAFGVRNADTKEPVTADTIFQAASLSKPVFASVVLRLVEQGALDLDRPLKSYFAVVEAPVTARQALSHTTGFPNWRFKEGELLTPAFPPGERFSYSGEGYYLLQRVVEHITGREFAEYMRERALASLGMSRSSYLRLPEHEALAAAGHGRRGRPLERPAAPPRGLPDLPNYKTPNAAASLVTTAPDYARFLVHALRLEGMRKPQIKINSELSWGLGWGLEGSAFWHWGDNTGFKNFCIVDAATRSGVVVFTNGDGGAKVWQRVVQHVMGRDLAAFLWI